MKQPHTKAFLGIGGIWLTLRIAAMAVEWWTQ